MRFNQKLFYLFLILFIRNSLPQKDFYDSTFNHKIIYKSWEVLWNDSIAIRNDLNTFQRDTIYCNISEYDDSDTNSFPYYYEESNQILSIVGPYLSYEYSYNGSGGAHPIYGSCYATYNIETKDEVSLDNIFNPNDIYTALLADSTIIKYLKKKEPNNLQDLLQNLDGDCEVNFYSILNNFAFVNVDEDKVLIEFGLTHGCEVLRGNFTVIQIILPIPVEKSSIFYKALKDRTLERYL